jgi:hypothetical protein
MIRFVTTLEQLMSLPAIAQEMVDSGLDRTFVVRSTSLASTDQGVFELMELWSEATTSEDRDGALADLKSILDETGS